jgi:hypothetical protein
VLNLMDNWCVPTVRHQLIENRSRQSAITHSALFDKGSKKSSHKNVRPIESGAATRRHHASSYNPAVLEESRFISSRNRDGCLRQPRY